MGLSRKKPEEFLVTHPPERVRRRLGREAAAADVARLPADVTGVAAALRAIADPEHRASVLAAIQARFGNAFAERVARTAQAGTEREPPEDGAGEPPQ